jgi:hypothetical protein
MDFYTEVQDLSFLQQFLDKDTFSSHYKKLNHVLCELVEDFSLVAFHTLNIEVGFSIVLNSQMNQNPRIKRVFTTY